MRTRDARARGVALGLAGGLAFSCATNPAPSGHTVSQEEAISSGKGAFALVSYFDRPAPDVGELIEATERRLLLLSADGKRLIEIDRRHVSELTLGVHGNHADVMGAWAAIGSLSTISHGVFLIFTLPLWLATGIGSASMESHRGLFHCPADTRETSRTVSMPQCLVSAGAYARFPQGLPPGVGREQLLGRAPVIAPTPRPGAAPPASARDGGAAEAPPPYDKPD